jgi:parvulin-like peptidyl-prolyl isomerase
VTQRLYDYQRNLVAERYLQDLRQQARVVSNEQVERYYKDHLQDFTRPGEASIAMIKTTDKAKAEEALAKLRQGIPFVDVATSYSVDQASAKAQGIVGYISERDNNIPTYAELAKEAARADRLLTPEMADAA